MSKSVLISIQPYWCMLIANGDKTVEVRKTRPKLKTPFKCYIYCTWPKKSGDIFHVGGKNPRIGNGKIIGEFVCVNITGCFLISPWGDWLLKQTCLTYKEIDAYERNKPLFYWHISNLKIYDRPKELDEFCKPCTEFEKDYPQCGDCFYYYYENFCDACMCEGLKPINTPPQSWCYVEESKDA